MFQVDDAEWGLLKGRDPARLNFRTVEYHEYGVGGQLKTERHLDAGSLITLDIMLAEPGVDYDGGQLITPEADGSECQPEFNLGDVCLFVSHKYHNVKVSWGGGRRR